MSATAQGPIVRVTPEELQRFAPNARADYRKALEARLDPLLAGARINESGLRLSHFMAQIAHECGLFTIRFENLRYTKIARLLEIFGVGNHSAKVTEAEAPALLNNPEALAERVYGLGNPKKAKELGNTQPGDGFRYRGHGFLQITGRGSFRRHGTAINVDVEANPHLAADGEISLALAVVEWRSKSCNDPADADDLREVTRRINGGFNGLTERARLLDAAKAIWLHKPPG
jgi:putative chitinase